MIPKHRSSPLLHSGDRMSQAEFHRLYKDTPDGFKAELINGVVYVASPLGKEHAVIHAMLSGVLFNYVARTPGAESADNLTTILDGEREPQPDLLLRIDSELKGQSTYNSEGFLVGGPELIAEVAHSSKAIDLGAKRSDYFRAGVQEYLVVSIHEQELHWFHFPSRRKLRADTKGVYRSKVFPGLWLDGRALMAKDSAALLRTITAGTASPEHVAFVQDLAKRRKR